MNKMLMSLSVYCLLLMRIKDTGGIEYQEACVISNQTFGISEGMICVQMPTNQLPPTVTALKVKGEIRNLRKPFFEPNKHLEKLDLSFCNVSEIEFFALSPLKELKLLILSNNSIDIITEEYFSGLNLLEELYLDGNGMKVIFEGSFKDLKGLKILNLANNNLLEMPGELPSSLVELNVMNNEIEILSMEKIQNLFQLKVFQACGNDIHNWPEGEIFPALRTLCLGDKVTMLTTNISTLPSIQKLRLSARRLNHGTMGPTLMERISALTTLQSIELENYEIKSFGFLINMSNLNSVTLLNINYTPQSIQPFPTNLDSLTINGSPCLAHSLLRTSDLFLKTKMLSLKNNKIEVINKYQSERLMTNLESLDLSSNPLNCTTTEEWAWLLEKIKYNREYLKDKENVFCDEPHNMKSETLFKVLQLMEHANSLMQETPYFEENVTMSEQQTVGNKQVFYGLAIFLSSSVPYVLLFTIITGIVYKKRIRNASQNEESTQYESPKNVSLGKIFNISELQGSNFNRRDQHSQDPCQQSSKSQQHEQDINQNQIYNNN
uniref:Unkown protein n=1 Tax=Riptortus pedestris TaxID=329032 RepID=R4WJG3_RIPPE|nr:unkown protein [Riptortus pedestris]